MRVFIEMEQQEMEPIKDTNDKGREMIPLGCDCCKHHYTNIIVMAINDSCSGTI